MITVSVIFIVVLVLSVGVVKFRNGKMFGKKDELEDGWVEAPIMVSADVRMFWEDQENAEAYKLAGIDPYQLIGESKEWVDSMLEVKEANGKVIGRPKPKKITEHHIVNDDPDSYQSNLNVISETAKQMRATYGPINVVSDEESERLERLRKQEDRENRKSIAQFEYEMEKDRKRLELEGALSRLPYLTKQEIEQLDSEQQNKVLRQRKEKNQRLFEEAQQRIAEKRRLEAEEERRKAAEQELFGTEPVPEHQKDVNARSVPKIGE